MMDDVACKLKMDPVEFILKNMREARAGRHRTPTTRSTSASAAAPSCSTGRRGGVRCPDPTAARSSAAPACRSWRSAPGLGRSSAVLRVDAKGRYTLFVGVTDVGGGAKTTMGMIAAEELGVPLSQVDVVWGDTDRCPYSVGESGSRTTIMTGYAVVEAARDLEEADRRERDADGRQRADRVGDPNPGTDGKVRNCFGAHFVEVDVDTAARPRARPQVRRGPRLGRIMNPLTAQGSDPRRGAAGHRHGAARGPALRPAQRPAAHRRLLRRARAHASRRAGRSTSSSSSRTTATGRSARRASASRA